MKFRCHTYYPFDLHALEHLAISRLDGFTHGMRGRVATHHHNGFIWSCTFQQSFALPRRPHAHHWYWKKTFKDSCSDLPLFQTGLHTSDVSVQRSGPEESAEEFNIRFAICHSQADCRTDPAGDNQYRLDSPQFGVDIQCIKINRHSLCSVVG